MKKPLIVLKVSPEKKNYKNIVYFSIEKKKIILDINRISGEMASRGVTQELIDETRASTEMQMLHDLQQKSAIGEDLEYKDHQGATPVSPKNLLNKNKSWEIK